MDTRIKGRKGRTKSLIPLRRLPEDYSGGGKNSTGSDLAGLDFGLPSPGTGYNHRSKRPRPMAVEPLTWTFVAQATQA